MRRSWPSDGNSAPYAIVKECVSSCVLFPRSSTRASGPEKSVCSLRSCVRVLHLCVRLSLCHFLSRSARASPSRLSRLSDLRACVFLACASSPHAPVDSLSSFSGTARAIDVTSRRAEVKPSRNPRQRVAPRGLRSTRVFREEEVIHIGSAVRVRVYPVCVPTATSRECVSRGSAVRSLLFALSPSPPSLPYHRLLALLLLLSLPLRPIVHVVFLSSPLGLPASLFFPSLPSLFLSVETTVECTTTLPRPSLLSSARALPLSSPSSSLPSSASHADRGAAPRVIATRRTFQ